MKPASRDGSYQPTVSPSATIGCAGGPPGWPFGSPPLPRFRPRCRRPRRPNRSRRCSNWGRPPPLAPFVGAGLAAPFPSLAPASDDPAPAGRSPPASAGGAPSSTGAAPRGSGARGSGGAVSAAGDASAAELSRYGSGSADVDSGAVCPRDFAGRPRRRGRRFSLMRVCEVMDRCDAGPNREYAARPREEWTLRLLLGDQGPCLPRTARPGRAELRTNADRLRDEAPGGPRNAKPRNVTGPGGIERTHRHSRRLLAGVARRQRAAGRRGVYCGRAQRAGRLAWSMVALVRSRNPPGHGWTRQVNCAP